MPPKRKNTATKAAPAPKGATPPVPAAESSFAIFVTELNTALDEHEATTGIRNALGKFTASVADLYARKVKSMQETLSQVAASTATAVQSKSSPPSPAPASYASAAGATSHHSSPKELRELRVRCPEGA